MLLEDNFKNIAAPKKEVKYDAFQIKFMKIIKSINEMEDIKNRVKMIIDNCDDESVIKLRN